MKRNICQLLPPQNWQKVTNQISSSKNIGQTFTSYEQVDLHYTGLEYLTAKPFIFLIRPPTKQKD